MLTFKPCLSDRRGSVAVEFALLALIAVLVILFIMSTSLTLYLNQTLDHATAQASRQIRTGSAQATALSSADFRTNLCGFLPKTMTCGNLIINLYVVPKEVYPSGFYKFVKSDQSGLLMPNLNGGSSQFNLGGRGDYQYLQVIYPITFPGAAILMWLSGGTTYNGMPAYLAISTAAFRNEQF